MCFRWVRFVGWKVSGVTARVHSGCGEEGCLKSSPLKHVREHHRCTAYMCMHAGHPAPPAQELIGQHAVVDTILEHRRLAKLEGCLDGMLRTLEAQDPCASSTIRSAMVRCCAIAAPWYVLCLASMSLLCNPPSAAACVRQACLC